MTGTDGVIPDDDDQPFDESTLIEFAYQVFAGPDEVERVADALIAAVASVIAAVGRYQPGRVALASVRDGQHDERHSASRRRREPGQNLYDVTFAVRGCGYSNRLSNSIFHAVHDAGLDWEQMTETYLTGPDLQLALHTYPHLAMPT